MLLKMKVYLFRNIWRRESFKTVFLNRWPAAR